MIGRSETCEWCDTDKVCKLYLRQDGSCRWVCNDCKADYVLPYGHEAYWVVICPYCAAKPGLPCFKYTGNVRKLVDPHTARIVKCTR